MMPRLTMQPLLIISLLAALATVVFISLWAVPSAILTAPEESASVQVSDPQSGTSSSPLPPPSPPDHGSPPRDSGISKTPTISPSPPGDPAAIAGTFEPTLANKTLQREREVVVAMEKIRARQSNLTKGVYALTRPCGQTCNNYLSFALALTLAKMSNSRFLLWGRWKEIVIQFDVDRLAEMVGDDLLVDHDESHNRYLKHSCSEHVWCASRLSLDIIRDVLRPPKRDQEMGLASLARMRAAGASVVVSVHGRFIRGSCQTLSQRLGNFCHERDVLDAAMEDKFINHYCTYGLSDALIKQVKATWNRDWTREKLGFFLSTDSFQTWVDATYRNASRWPAEVHVAHVPVGTTMPADMWTSVFAEYYMSTPVSSCEGIVAQWRNKFNRPGGMWPPACYKSYSSPQRSSGFCEHTNVVILDTPPPTMTICERILALGSAIVKAKQGGILIWGPWRELVDQHLDLDHLRRTFPRVEFSMNAVMRTHSRMYSRPSNWYSMRLDPVKELQEVTGRAVVPVLLGLRPSPTITAKVVSMSGGVARQEKGPESLNMTLPPRYCAASSEATSTFSAPSPPRVGPAHEPSVDQMWTAVQASTLELDGSLACHQVVALWRAALNKTTLPHSCFAGYGALGTRIA